MKIRSSPSKEVQRKRSRESQQKYRNDYNNKVNQFESIVEQLKSNYIPKCIETNALLTQQIQSRSLHNSQFFSESINRFHRLWQLGSTKDNDILFRKQLEYFMNHVHPMVQFESNSTKINGEDNLFVHFQQFFQHMEYSYLDTLSIHTIPTSPDIIIATVKLSIKINVKTLQCFFPHQKQLQKQYEYLIGKVVEFPSIYTYDFESIESTYRIKHIRYMVQCSPSFLQQMKRNIKDALYVASTLWSLNYQ